MVVVAAVSGGGLRIDHGIYVYAAELLYVLQFLQEIIPRDIY